MPRDTYNANFLRSSSCDLKHIDASALRFDSYKKSWMECNGTFKTMLYNCAIATEITDLMQTDPSQRT